MDKSQHAAMETKIFYDFTVHTTIGNHILISRNCQPLLEVRPVLAPTIWKQGSKDVR